MSDTEWDVYGPTWDEDYGWSWAARSPQGAYMGANHLSSEQACKDAIKKHTGQEK